VPTLRFFHDPQLKRGIEMSALIDQANLPGQYAGVSDEPEDKP
jgi:ribosome-binding factor A